MKHHQAPFLTGGMRQALHCAALLLLSGMAPESTLAGSRPRSGIRTIGDWRTPVREPYLIALGAPGLRFREPEPVADPAPRPVAVGPPVVGLEAAEAAVAVANAAAVQPPIAGDTKSGSAPVSGSVTTTGSGSASAAGSASTSAATPGPAITPGIDPASPVIAKPVPAPIMVDDLRPQVRAEDFLPYFQIPGSSPAGDANAVPAARSAPGPAPLPASSAVYQQSPK